MTSLFYVQYEVRPTHHSANWSTCGGAFVNCYVLANNKKQAISIILAAFAREFWEVISLEEGPEITKREWFLEEPEILERIDEALATGESYDYHLWPVEPQDEDTIH